VTKDEIIQMTGRRVGRHIAEGEAMGFDTPGAEEYRAIVETTLMERLPPGTNFKTCKDFGHLAAGCCECCHSIYEHYEMELEDLPSGEKAWICCSLRSALFEPRGMDQLQEEVVDLERFLGFDDGRAADSPANLQQGNEMHIELITHTCGHGRTYSRPSAEALKLVAEYARTTLCWDYWKQARARGEL
jgi:hypothetical protein